MQGWPPPSPTLRLCLCLGFPGLEEQETSSLQEARWSTRISIQQADLTARTLYEGQEGPQPMAWFYLPQVCPVFHMLLTQDRHVPLGQPTSWPTFYVLKAIWCCWNGLSGQFKDPTRRLGRDSVWLEAREELFCSSPVTNFGLHWLFTSQPHGRRLYSNLLNV